jgi:hypothetical protein
VISQVNSVFLQKLKTVISQVNSVFFGCEDFTKTKNFIKRKTQLLQLSIYEHIFETFNCVSSTLK